jgi:ATP-dependent RNA helicase DHX29
VFVRDSTTVAPAALLLFGGVMDVRHETGRVCLDGWLWLRASAQTAVLYKKLRKALDDELDARIAGTRGRKNGGDTGGGNDTLLKTIRSLLTEAASS